MSKALHRTHIYIIYISLSPADLFSILAFIRVIVGPGEVWVESRRPLALNMRISFFFDWSHLLCTSQSLFRVIRLRALVLFAHCLGGMIGIFGAPTFPFSILHCFHVSLSLQLNLYKSINSPGLRNNLELLHHVAQARSPPGI
ncbi:uncharacterized protein C8R40DRAFT_520065 [Lentinula edodes]|uniref:uncharacterized protein n=1 Tax=Lentinula edodes TaxID=5353 RepID=UPI001E8D86D4|nr:uncharacterized protein C8R40DRAFT_520065 [Lentinula edodes]KAH7872021.1 hypothetical protein C8R40DRAFT_520065 [Lentinula edodes]